MEGSAEWARSDAWVLAAIMVLDGDEGSSLTEVVAAGDAINHAILLENEIEQAVRRLRGVDLISTSQRRFFLTDSGRTMAARRRGGMIGQVDHLLTTLRRLPVREQEWHLEPGELREAVDGWHRRAEAIAKGGRRRRSATG
ncbi:hypothetical protein EV384_5246 [Micromonospora kangleipakensis]|uniref:Uncharacterized protein n=1 Tax=Micromonospora kangleipakensis TaxID=1077942 RepID=A0A4Q8BF47_9ACTN|nr:hypothetical protein [Micromonospora kangleipakensis]RZU76580.1 hypothetical protein EV384_5246 [Micromonospora kangleipakensis]